MSKIKTRKDKETAELRRQIEVLKSQLKSQNIEPIIENKSHEDKTASSLQKSPKKLAEASRHYDFEADIKRDIFKTLIISSVILSIILSVWVYTGR